MRGGGGEKGHPGVGGGGRGAEGVGWGQEAHADAEWCGEDDGEIAPLVVEVAGVQCWMKPVRERDWLQESPVPKCNAQPTIFARARWFAGSGIRWLVLASVRFGGIRLV